MSFVGFAKHWGQPVVVGGADKVIRLNPIQLLPDEAQLSEVTVTARKPYIERLADRTIVNPGGADFQCWQQCAGGAGKSAGRSGERRRRCAPEGRSGVAIFIDDKPTYLSGAELESYLRSIPASSVKQIELMPNPPAKYEAAGNAGVINIVTKRNKAPGFNGNTSLAYTQGKYNRSNNSLNLNLTRQKFGLDSNLGAGPQFFPRP